MSDYIVYNQETGDITGIPDENRISDDIVASLKDEIDRLNAMPEVNACKIWNVNSREEAMILAIDAYFDGVMGMDIFEYYEELKERDIVDYCAIQFDVERRKKAVEMEKQNAEIRNDINSRKAEIVSIPAGIRLQMAIDERSYLDNLFDEVDAVLTKQLKAS